MPASGVLPGAPLCSSLPGLESRGSFVVGFLQTPQPLPAALTLGPVLGKVPTFVKATDGVVGCGFLSALLHLLPVLYPAW